jgi:hypothetical protein
VYHFDKKTAIDVPSYILQYTGAETMAISTWIWMQKNREQQSIISASDPERLDRKHFALYTEGNLFQQTCGREEAESPLHLFITFLNTIAGDIFRLLERTQELSVGF